MADPQSPASQGEPLDLAESVAGEEDPGASIDLAMPGRSAQVAEQGSQQSPGAQPRLSPGDEAPPGTPGTGEDVCPRCGGSGRQGATECPECGGTGKVNVGIGGA